MAARVEQPTHATETKLERSVRLAMLPKLRGCYLACLVAVVSGIGLFAGSLYYENELESLAQQGSGWGILVVLVVAVGSSFIVGGIPLLAVMWFLYRRSRLPGMPEHLPRSYRRWAWGITSALLIVAGLMVAYLFHLGLAEW